VIKNNWKLNFNGFNFVFPFYIDTSWLYIELISNSVEDTRITVHYMEINEMNVTSTYLVLTGSHATSYTREVKVSSVRALSFFIILTQK